MLNNFSSIFWDFDGVILNSDKVRTDGFRHIFENYSKQEVDKLIDYHTINGGLSRYDKIEYFSQKISKKKNFFTFNYMEIIAEIGCVIKVF
jgi:beta-phosphoglucomutase-like phosphatase (HAD superfamily)